MNVSMQVDIEAPIEAVWSFLDDPAKFPLWMPEVVKMAFPAVYDRENPVGTRFRQIVREHGRRKIYLDEVTAYERFGLLGLTSGDGIVDTEITFRLRLMGTGTRLDYRADISANNLAGRVASVLFRPMTMRQLAGHLENLKRIAEDTAAASGAGTEPGTG